MAQLESPVHGTGTGKNRPSETEEERKTTPVEKPGEKKMTRRNNKKENETDQEIERTHNWWERSCLTQLSVKI